MEKQKATILIVDDERINRALLRSTLDRKYETILEAEDGVEAIRMVKDNDVHLILLDLMMPKMNGYEVLKTLRDDPDYQLIPIVVITALSGLEEHSKAIDLGADAFLTKPFNKVLLEAIAQNLLKQHVMQKRLMEMKKAELYLATVVTANHEINQPLTSIMCSVSLLGNCLEGDRVKDVEKYNIYLERVSDSAKSIADTLGKLRAVKQPEVKTYIDDVQMVDIDRVYVDRKAVHEEPARVHDEDRETVLIVDEEHDITETLKDYFQESGVNVKIFNDYSGAKSEYESARDKIDLVFIDVRLPDKEGLKLFYELKEADSDANIILTSAYNIKDDIFLAIKAGAKAFIPKPYNINNLKFFVAKIFDK